MSDILWEDGAERICLRRQPTDGFLQLVANTTFTSGQRHYKRANLFDQIQRFTKAVFLTAEHADRTVGSYVLDEHQLSINREPHLGFYRAMLSVDPQHRGDGVSQRLVSSARDWMRARSATLGKPGLSWGCIAESNTAARRLLKRTGHTEIGALSARLEYRQWPRLLGTTVDLESTTPQLLTAWNHLIADARWRAEHPPAGPWILAKQGKEWIACCYQETVLDLTPLSGMYGWIDRHLMSRFAPGRKRFDPSHFNYVSVTQTLSSRHGGRLWKHLRNALMVRHQTHFVNVIQPLLSRSGAVPKGDLVVSACRLEDNPTQLTGGQAMLWPPDM